MKRYRVSWRDNGVNYAEPDCDERKMNEILLEHPDAEVKELACIQKANKPEQKIKKRDGKVLYLMVMARFKNGGLYYYRTPVTPKLGNKMYTENGASVTVDGIVWMLQSELDMLCKQKNCPELKWLYPKKP